MSVNPIQQSTSSSTLGNVLELILDKGIVVAGDISIALADIELLTIRIRLVIASIDKAKEMGIDWWRSDPYLSSNAKIESEKQKELENTNKTKLLEEQNKLLLERMKVLEEIIENGD